MKKDVDTLLSGATSSCQEALEVFDGLEPVSIVQMLGGWSGAEIPSHHPMDGVLAFSGWCGKCFVDEDTVHPLLFWGWKQRRVYAAEPRLMPMLPWLPRHRLLGGVVWLLSPILQTRRPRARLRMLDYRGVSSAAMIYDHIPVIDSFRQIDEDRVMGVMDARGFAQPYFFLLERDDEVMSRVRL